jgi:type I restriction enzyme M protein
LEAVEVKFCDLSSDRRIDAEYYDPKFLISEQLLSQKHFVFLGKVCSQIHRNPMMYGFDYVENGIPYFRIDDLDSPIINQDNLAYISSNVNDQFFSTQLFYNDILMGVRGATIGRLGVYKGENRKGNISPNLIYFRLKLPEIADYVSTFLISKYGLNQIYRVTTGTAQPTITSIFLKTIKIPIFNEQFQSRIVQINLMSRNILNQSKELYQQAENLLLTELGLKDWQPTEESIAVKSFSESFLSSGRLDAEYYQPKYDEIEKQVKSYIGGWTNIRDVLIKDIKNGTTPEGVIQEFMSNKPKFVRVEAFNQSLEIDEEKLYSIEHETLIKYRSISVDRDDVLVSMTGTIGNVAVYLIDALAIINQNIVKLTCNQSIINPYILALYIKSVGRPLLIRQQTGNVQPYVNIPNFQKLIIPLLTQEIQSRILTYLEEASHQRNKSKQLLEIAKIGVEKAIETDEETAAAWINQQLESLGVNLI